MSTGIASAAAIANPGVAPPNRGFFSTQEAEKRAQASLDVLVGRFGYNELSARDALTTARFVAHQSKTRSDR